MSPNWRRCGEDFGKALRAAEKEISRSQNCDQGLLKDLTKEKLGNSVCFGGEKLIFARIITRCMMKCGLFGAPAPAEAVLQSVCTRLSNIQ